MNYTNLNETISLNLIFTESNYEKILENITLEDYIIFSRGPKYLSLKIVIPITIIYSVLFLSGLVGNIAVCFVIATNISMHTPTNYYLFSLALSDLALLILGLPNDLSIYWQQYPWVLGLFFCKTRALVSEMCSYVSVLTIVAFSVERYIAICHPLTSYKTDKLTRVMKVICALWIISFFSALPFAVFTTINYIDWPIGSGIAVNESAFCAMLKDNVPPDFPIYELSSVLFFLLPAFVLTYLYIRIGLIISKNQNVNGSIHGEQRTSQSRKSIVRMLMAVVVAFFICWAPFHLQRVMYIYMSNLPIFHIINMWMYHISGILYYFSATVNPILYNLMSVKYRTAFKQTLFCKKDSRYNSLARTSSNKESNGRSNTIRKHFYKLRISTLNSAELDEVLETQI
ncbi:hypothetical protein O3M35_003780 [Rhynocoris fuscipes]|uniref:G-protein coupled receptors family 1 profile domain-containing protein n=1 Tax=Rhynocoris fuscipes TaxID=488301 RepID=A0AAW1CIJ3_9HEMI